ncbi:MAG: hypothetical protein ACRDSR_21105 [Pseudonocardiaceae bacterium]
MAASGDFANPLTLAIAHQQFKSNRLLRFNLCVLTFRPGVQTPDDPAAATRQAKAARADVYQGVFDKVRITGYRSQTWSPLTAWTNWGIGGRRANAVAELFLEEGLLRDQLVVSDAGGTTKFGTSNDVVEVTAEHDSAPANAPSEPGLVMIGSVSPRYNLITGTASQYGCPSSIAWR